MPWISACRVNSASISGLMLIVIVMVLPAIISAGSRSRLRTDAAGLRACELRRGETVKRVAGLLPKTTLQSTEISGKRGGQVVESNETNILAKTLNQWVEGSIPSRLIESNTWPTGNEPTTALLAAMLTKYG